jgi:hypothetical protein
MSKKRTKTNSGSIDDLKGFEEVLDLVGMDPAKAQKNINEGQIEDYEIYDFLEKENIRLEKLDRFFNTQIPIEKKYGQTRKLIKKEIGEVNLIKDELTMKLMHPQSDFQNFLTELYKKAFN